MNSVGKFLTSFSVVGVMLLAACSAHVSGGDGAPPSPDAQANFMDPRPTIAGPTVEGHWTSSCNPVSGQSNYRQYDITFKGATVVRNETMFSDVNCSTSSGTLNYHGRFRFIDKYSDGSYDIEYGFALGGGVTTFPQEKILVANNRLLVSEFVTGELAYLLSGEPLTLASQATSAIVTSSTNVPAQQVSSYADARYAFCSTQGYGIMVDFTGGDLSRDGSGIARTGAKVCGSSSDIRWGNSPVRYSVTLVSGVPQITFPDSDSSDYIKPSGYQNGLANKSGASTLLGGNSGECYFLKNAGTLNLDFTYSCQ